MMPTPEDRAAYHRDGAVVVRNLLTDDEIDRLRTGVSVVMDDPSPLAVVGRADGEPGVFFEDFCNWSRIPEFEHVIAGSAVAEVGAALMASGSVRLFHDHVLVKSGGTSLPTPWHQDQPYYFVDGRQNVSFWIALDSVPMSATLELLAGSHDGTWYQPRSFIEGTPMVFDEGTLAEVPDIDADLALDSGAHQILRWELSPGDAIAFHMLTLHRANGSADRRRAFSVRLLGDDARYALRPNPTSPRFDDLGTLASGDPFDHPAFPVLWTADPG